MKHSFALGAIFAALFSLPALAQDATQTPVPAAGDYVMLKVNGDDIKKSEVDDAWKSIFEGREVPPFETLDPKIKDKFLHEVASEHVLYKEAQKEGMEDSPEVKLQMQKIKHQLAIQELIKIKTESAVSDDKLKAAYDEHVKASQEAGSAQDEIKARHILVKTKEEADAIEKKLKAGGDFAKLAKEKSQDKASGATGGDLGWFTADKMLPDFSTAAFKLKKGEISAPVKTDFGWHIIQLEDRRKATPPAFSEVRDTLKQEVGTKAVTSYVQSLMTNVKIVALDPSGKEIPMASMPAKAAAAPATKDDKDEKDGSVE